APARQEEQRTEGQRVLPSDPNARDRARDELGHGCRRKRQGVYHRGVRSAFIEIWRIRGLSREPGPVHEHVDPPTRRGAVPRRRALPPCAETDETAANLGLSVVALRPRGVLGCRSPRGSGVAWACAVVPAPKEKRRNGAMRIVHSVWLVLA